MPAFRSVLIANRGEIAARVASTAAKLGIRSIGLYSDADAGAYYTRFVDEAHYVGPPAARESYLNVDAILRIAKETGAEAIHPGYGFLSENAAFAEACAAAGIVFVGPPPAAIRAMGLKGDAKSLMQKAGVPVVPGYHGERQDTDFLREKAYEIGYPVLIKAVAGGGGKGMRRVDRVLDFDDALAGAQREAQNAFGDPRVLVEKYILNPRHVEIQVFADGHGNAISLYERDCSLQRRHQKVIEEAPAPGMTDGVRRAMSEAAVAAAKAVGYVGAGTVEFIADGSRGLRADGFYFMEMNTRLQVEHPVTEAITGLDLVEWQFRVAAGEPLPLTQEEVRIDGHAVEARLYAEDPRNGFLPSTGRLHAFAVDRTATSFAVAPHGVRIDRGLREGDSVSPWYDPMIAKVIAHGASRDEALDRLSQALADIDVAGPATNAGFLRALADHPAFRAGRFDTGFIAAHSAELGGEGRPPHEQVVLEGLRGLMAARRRRAEDLASARGAPAQSPWATIESFQLGDERTVPFRVDIDGEFCSATLRGERAISLQNLASADAPPRDHIRTATVGDTAYVSEGGWQYVVRLPDATARLEAAEHEGDGSVTAPMHGKVTAVLVTSGATVAKGDRLAVVEAMKMEHAVTAPFDGTVTEILAVPGAQVAQGARLLVVEPSSG